ncbi:MAG: hypothetical protein PHG06_17985, partial [Parabacteroides sp.]|nr:hypothetical protein [Parabacteroides sp.]
LRYGVDKDGAFSLERSLIWPMLRTNPNYTHSSLMQRFAVDHISSLIVNGQALSNEKVKTLRLDGRLTVVSELAIGYSTQGLKKKDLPSSLELTRTFFPSTDKPMLCEKYTLKNITDKTITVMVPQQRSVYKTDKEKSYYGVYTLIAAISNSGLYAIEPGKSISFDAFVAGYKEGQVDINPEMAKEEQARIDFVKEVWGKLHFECPDNVLNTAFAFAKIRGAESIYKTKGGYMHGPGGESYYAAIWANDQAEYINPFFPFLGYKTGNQSALNSFKHFARFINTEYKPIPSSIISEGIEIWNGAGDRGDGAMIAYGAARYALAGGNLNEASELWPLIEWCLEFCKRKTTIDGVVASDSDELEGRFPAGKANLCTSSLYYDALISASYLAKELGKPSSISKKYMKEAKELKKAINSYFGSVVEGFETYRYYEGNDILRSWISIPLTVGIFERKSGTIDALFSPRLWTENGLLTQAGSEIFWDRSTLYALRGVYAAGAREKGTEYMKHYSTQRLLGEHVPYPIEAWPEGNQRHLSAESGLYCRIITEGLFGIRPTGFNSFTLTPQLPDEWPFMTLENIGAFQSNPFTIKVTRSGNKLKTSIIKGEEVLKTYISNVGETFTVTNL